MVPGQARILQFPVPEGERPAWLCGGVSFVLCLPSAASSLSPGSQLRGWGMTAEEAL